MMKGAVWAVALVVFGPWACSSGDATRTDGGMPDGSDKPMGPSPQLCTDACDVIYEVECPGLRPKDKCLEDCNDPNILCPAEEKAFDECLVAHGPTSVTCVGMSVQVAAACVPEGMSLSKCFASLPAESVLASATPGGAWHSIFSLGP
jgi:hypothetical protein